MLVGLWANVKRIIEIIQPIMGAPLKTPLIMKPLKIHSSIIGTNIPKVNNKRNVEALEVIVSKVFSLLTEDKLRLIIKLIRHNIKIAIVTTIHCFLVINFH